jgi:hypothetical protein
MSSRAPSSCASSAGLRSSSNAAGAGRSAFGYSTAPAVHREVRAALANRDTREIARVNHGAIVGPRNPIANGPDSAGFISPHARFDTRDSRAIGAAPTDRAEADARKRKIEAMKDSRATREASRWESMDTQLRKEQEAAAHIAGTGLRNRGSVGYNLINGSWGSSQAAAKAKFHDDRVEYTAKLRTQNLDRRSNSSFNVLTGEERNVVRVPPKPTLPPINP